jgi:hypothetical protein
MNNFISNFKQYCVDRNWTFDDYCSEFTFQFRICRYLENINPTDTIELESSIERYNYGKLHKKEIDIDITTQERKKIALEIKYIRDKGAYNISMYKYCEDIAFLEGLVEQDFQTGYAIVFTTIPELFTHPKRKLNPKNKENLCLYNAFRIKSKLSGKLSIKTGKMDETLELKGEYDLQWEVFSDNIKACIVRIN